MKALLINELDTFEFTMIDSKYCKVLIFSLIVVLDAIELYTSDKWLSIWVELIFSITSSEDHGVKFRYDAFNG